MKKEIILTKDESIEFSRYGYVIINRDGYNFFIKKGLMPESITITLINYQLKQSK